MTAFGQNGKDFLFKNSNSHWSKRCVLNKNTILNKNTMRLIATDGYTWKETQRQTPHHMDGRYQETYGRIWPRRPNDGRQEGLVNDRGNGRHLLVYETQGEMYYASETYAFGVRL